MAPASACLPRSCARSPARWPITTGWSLRRSSFRRSLGMASGPASMPAASTRLCFLAGMHPACASTSNRPCCRRRSRACSRTTSRWPRSATARCSRPARAADGRSVPRGRRTTDLTLQLEMLAWRLTRHRLGDYDRTYPQTVQDEAASALASPSDFRVGPPAALRDSDGMRWARLHRARRTLPVRTQAR